MSKIAVPLSHFLIFFFYVSCHCQCEVVGIVVILVVNVINDGHARYERMNEILSGVALGHTRLFDPSPTPPRPLPDPP